MIKTTKTDFKQKQVFHDTMDVKGKATFSGDVEVDGIIQSNTNINAEKITLPNDSNFEVTHTYDSTYDILNVISDSKKALKVTFGTQYKINLIADNYNIRMIFERGPWKYNSLIFPVASTQIGGSTLALKTDINNLSNLSLTKGSTNVYSHEFGEGYSAGIEVVVILTDNATKNKYVANFYALAGSKSAFLMPYGTTSDDVATCFATYTDGTGYTTITIDLDNVPLSDISVVAKYYRFYQG